MGKKLKWYCLRWRILVLGLLLILSVSGYIGWRLYLAVRVLPMGDGPAGPVIGLGAFKDTWSDEKVVLIGIGDSITWGLGAEKKHTYFELLQNNDDEQYPDMAGRDLNSVFTRMEAHNYAKSSTVSQTHVERQLKQMEKYPTNVKGIVVITSGGNDLIHDYGKSAPRDGAMYGCSYAQGVEWTRNLKERIRALLEGIMERFPGGCEIFLANIYDPTDGVSDPYIVGLPRWGNAVKVVGLANDKIAELCEDYDNVHLVDIHSAFLGHGIHCTEFWRQHYHRDDPHYWYYYNLEDPNRRGFDAIRRLFLREIVRFS